MHQLGTTDCWPLRFGQRLLIAFECRDGYMMCLIIVVLWLPSDSLCRERVLSYFLGFGPGLSEGCGPRWSKQGLSDKGGLQGSFTVGDN